MAMYSGNRLLKASEVETFLVDLDDEIGGFTDDDSVQDLHFLKAQTTSEIELSSVGSLDVLPTTSTRLPRLKGKNIYRGNSILPTKSGWRLRRNKVPHLPHPVRSARNIVATLYG